MNVNRMHLFASRNWLDEGVFEAIFYEHYPRIYAILFRLVGDHHEADDLTSETFWKLWENPPASDTNIGGWLYRVATRLGYNALRAARRRTQYEQQTGPFTGERPFHNEQAAERSPEHLAEQKSERERVHKILRQMNFRDVQLLILRHSGLSYKEIAEATQISVTSIGTLLTRAEEKFESLFRKSER